MENSLLSTIIIYDVFPIASLDTNGQTYDLETLVFKKKGKDIENSVYRSRRPNS